MSNQVQFWFNPSSDTLTWFFATTVLLVAIIYGVRFIHRRRIRGKLEGEFAQRMKEVGLLGQPEEQVLRSLVHDHGVKPPLNILSSLQTFDQIANEDIKRTVSARIPLAERIDRIEYLYSIRMHAFAEEPSVTGLGELIGVETGPAPLRMKGEQEPPAQIQGSPDIDLSSDPDFALLLGNAGDVPEPLPEEEISEEK
jgi:hypothetical protein